MTPEEYQTGLVQAWLIAKVVLAIPLDDMLAANDRADTIGAMLDPTLYRANAKKMHQDRRLIVALKGLAGEVLAMAREGAPGPGGPGGPFWRQPEPPRSPEAEPRRDDPGPDSDSERST